MLNSLSQAATEAKNSFPEFKDAIQLIWSALPEKAIDNTVKDYHKDKGLQACVLANSGYFEQFRNKLNLIWGVLM